MIAYYRSVEVRDKSFAQGLLLLILSLLALVPAPIMYGAIMDATCIQWGESCGHQSNCLLYNKDTFRIYTNITSLCKFINVIHIINQCDIYIRSFTGFFILGFIFEICVWYLAKNIDLYGEEEPLEEDNKSKREIELRDSSYM